MHLRCYRVAVFRHQLDVLVHPPRLLHSACGMGFQSQLKDLRHAAESRYRYQPDAALKDEPRIQDGLNQDADLTWEAEGRRYRQDVVVDAGFRKEQCQGERQVVVARVDAGFRKGCSRDVVLLDVELQMVWVSEQLVPVAQDAPAPLQLCAPAPVVALSVQPTRVRSPPEFRWQPLDLASPRLVLRQLS